MAEIRDTANTPPTIYDVARVAGVSIASVSRVLNGQRNPREETRERVLKAVAELGFAPAAEWRARGYRYAVLWLDRLCPERYPRRNGIPAKRPLF